MAQNDNNGGNLSLEAERLNAADKLHGNFEPINYGHIVRGLAFMYRTDNCFGALRTVGSSFQASPCAELGVPHPC